MSRREEVIRLFAEIRDAQDTQRVCRKIVELLSRRHEEIVIYGLAGDKKLSNLLDDLEVGSVIPTESGFTVIYSCWPEDIPRVQELTEANRRRLLDRICRVAGGEAELLNGLLIVPGYTDLHDGLDPDAPEDHEATEGTDDQEEGGA